MSAGGVFAPHPDPVSAVVISLAVILVAAKAAGYFAARMKQVPVMGELLAGVLLGNLASFGIPWFDSIKTNPGIELLAQLGVLILLFEVGLESTVGQMLRVGASSVLVALVGVTASLALGWLAAAIFLPAAGVYTNVFVAAALCATSVGITARVLKDIAASGREEARVILGAAVIDDVIGFALLGAMVAAIGAANSGSPLSIGMVGLTFAKAGAFLVVSLALGVVVTPRLFRLASHLDSRGVLLPLGLSICFVFAWLSGQVGLAPIVGAFAAGLVLEDLHFKPFTDRGEQSLGDLIRPISAFLVPVFFVLTGMRADIRLLANPEALGLAAALTVAAVLGKQACGLGVLRRGVDRVTVGLGMVPRGEFTLIFVGVGMTLSIGGRQVVTPAIYSATVLVVLATSLVTPPALRWSLRRNANPKRTA